jgi:NADH:ubiquinone oxidoreductase subunit F (NADH-binding)/NADH:ubiquinone oxidoreductase subunit E
VIIQELWRIQERCGYLPEEELRHLAKEQRVPLHRIHEIASFYPLYRLRPPAAVEVKVCRDMSCHLRGARHLQQRLERLALEKSETQIKVEGVSCLGQCDRPVAVGINEQIYHGLPEEELRPRIEAALKNDPMPQQRANRSPCGWKIDPYNGAPGYQALHRFVANRDGDAVLKALEDAHLGGMGGAGFPTFRKWAAVRAAASEKKYVICNADESEPGTFKDRELLRRTPHLVIEGMLLAGLVTGACKGYIYIRHEYHEETEALREALTEASRQRICGENLLGSELSFPIEIFISPGGYIQGEESALLEAMEDRRGEPRNKPPYPVTSGLYNQPTVINNVETLCWVPAIVLHGGEWYRLSGRRGAAGLRFVSISGDVNRPGVYEVPFGRTVRELIVDTAGGMRDGRKLKAIAPSGPSGGFLPSVIRRENLPERFRKERLPADAKSYDILDLPLDTDTLAALGSMLGGAFVAYGEPADMVDHALNCVQFFRNESCGKCVPCRLGSQRLVEIIEDVIAGRSCPEDLEAVADLAETMTATSICGLGMVAANPITSVIKHFPEDVAKYLKPGATRIEE